MENLSDKRAIVCGSSQGIGYASAQALASAGATCILVARNEARLRQAVETLVPPASGAHTFVVADFGDPNEVQAAVANHLAKTGPVQILINNTGGPKGGPIIDAAAAEFTAAFASHLIVNHLLAQTVVPGMRSSRYGRIINIISTSVKQPIKGLGVSNTIRAAVAGWAKTLATELAPVGITVNNVLPGATETARLESIITARANAAGESPRTIEDHFRAEIPMQRFGTAEEIAAAVAFLAGPSAGYITGVSLAVDGGRVGSLN
jgi:3-oxoacyl-[acyl-carrier protein] reductase